MEHPDPLPYTPLRHSIERMFGSEYLPEGMLPLYGDGAIDLEERKLLVRADVISLEAIWQTAVYPEATATDACDAGSDVVLSMRRVRKRIC